MLDTIFHSFWTFAGTLVLLIVLADCVTDWISAWRVRE